MGRHGAGFPHAQPPLPTATSSIALLAPELQGVRLGTLPKTQIRLLEATFLSSEVVSPGSVLSGAEGAGRQ